MRFPHSWVATRVLLAASLLVLQGCGCDLVGCVNGLTVQLARMPDGPYQVELLVAGAVQSAPAEATCSGAGTCLQNIYFNMTPTKNVSVRVTTSAGTRVTTFDTVSYAVSYPNGRRCDPSCRSARVTAELP